MFLIILSILAIISSTVILQIGNNMVAPLLVLRANAAVENLSYIGLIQPLMELGLCSAVFGDPSLLLKLGIFMHL